jgi:hypothetical protein
MDDSAARAQQFLEEHAKENLSQRARSKDALVNAYDTRLKLAARRCQRDNVLMEAVGIVNETAGYFCGVCSTVQLRPLATAF